jgi:cellulose 1,4-beta-cellobiosidase
MAATGAVALATVVVLPMTNAFAAVSCSVNYSVGTPWQDGSGRGFQVSLTLNNTGDPWNGWSLSFSLPAGQTFNQGWPVPWSGTTNLTATNASWNANVGTGGSVSLGFLARTTSTSGAVASPASFVVNGVTCGGTQPPTSTSTSTRPPTSSTSTRPPTSSTSTRPPTSSTSTQPPTSTTTNPPCTPTSCPRVDNPYAGADGYNNPQWRANAISSGASTALANTSTAVWFDRISAIAGNSSPTTGSMGLVDHLDAAVTQDAANGSRPLFIQIVIYNLPGRDCSALASNGELGTGDIARYRTEYIDPIRAIVARPAYANLRIIAIVEIDSLPNLVTNTGSRPTATATCNTMLQNGGYVQGVGYALAQLGSVPNVYNYVDAAHHGWLGWDDNFGPAAQIMAQAATASGSTRANVHGFITNTANYSALSETFVGPVTEQLRNTRWIDFNRYNDELTFAQAFRNRLVQEQFANNIGMLIDTSRNGWGGASRPTAPSTSTDPNTFVDQSRIDRRIHKGNWCNQSGAGMGERPRAAPATGIDAYVWVKPPGESDGSSSLIPNDEGKGFDRMCDPTYTGNALNGNNLSGALANAPLSGHWFDAQFRQLMANAFPPL